MQIMKYVISPTVTSCSCCLLYCWDFAVCAMLDPHKPLSRTKKIAHLVEGLPYRLVDFTLITRTHVEKLGMMACTYNPEAVADRFLEFDGQSVLLCAWQALEPERDLASNNKDNRKRNNTQSWPLLSTHTGTCVHIRTHTTLSILPRGRCDFIRLALQGSIGSGCIPRHSFIPNGSYQPFENRPEVLMQRRKE